MNEICTVYICLLLRVSRYSLKVSWKLVRVITPTCEVLDVLPKLCLMLTHSWSVETGDTAAEFFSIFEFQLNRVKRDDTTSLRVLASHLGKRRVGRQKQILQRRTFKSPEPPVHFCP